MFLSARKYSQEGGNVQLMHAQTDFALTNVKKLIQKARLSELTMGHLIKWIKSGVKNGVKYVAIFFIK